MMADVPSAMLHWSLALCLLLHCPRTPAIAKGKLHVVIDSSAGRSSGENNQEVSRTLKSTRWLDSLAVKRQANRLMAHERASSVV